MDYQTGLFFLSFLHAAFNSPDPFYTIHLDKYTFDNAQNSCKSDGFLTDMANLGETSKILKAIEDKGDKTLNLFWIGLRKRKEDCVNPDLPLRGFTWIGSNNTEFEADKWNSEPAETCTGVLCGLLSVTNGGSSTKIWHLTSSSCKQTYPFICKHNGRIEESPCPYPIIHGYRDIMQKNNDPYTLHVTCDGMDTITLTCSKSTHEWTLVESPGTDIAQLCQACQTGYRKDVHGNCVDINECEQPVLCKHHCINTEGSYVCKCPDGMEDDSKDCNKDKPTPTSMDKSYPPSPHPDSTTASIVEDMSNIIVPVIIALLIFVVLVVIAVGIVKCCLIRRAKKRAKKRAEASKESMALNGSDSIERVNEKL